MGTHFRMLAASSLSIWERFLTVEDLLRAETGWEPRESVEDLPDTMEPYAPWFSLLDHGCRSALGYSCLSEGVRAVRLDALLAEGEWYAWIHCYALGDYVTGVSLVERRAGEIVESRARLGRGFLLRKDPYLLLEVNELLGIPVRQCAP